MYVRMYVCVCMYIYVEMHVCNTSYIYIYTCMYMHIVLTSDITCHVRRDHFISPDN